eukprot:TRINITY_DN113057_c0_g1_i1.p1 TRINITY_DN113057_c0_g1~~TRINITY_DN113057_c0_g1_i1.p1  ORF type:complete len:484 (-),score=60.23 TRINITY_DN113057_c0_g1_i1:266-1717(-)
MACVADKEFAASMQSIREPPGLESSRESHYRHLSTPCLRTPCATSSKGPVDQRIEVVAERLHWTPVPPPTDYDRNALHYFSIDRELVYQPIAHDFGPLNIGMVADYCRHMEAALSAPAMKDKCFVQYSVNDPRKQANSALMVCAYKVVVEGRTADETWEPFARAGLSFLPFRDATAKHDDFDLTILDCLRGLEKAMACGWFHWHTFNTVNYSYFAKIENGDMNWLIPGKFLAFSEPVTPEHAARASVPRPGVVQKTHTVPDYAQLFRGSGIELVIRLNRRSYDPNGFIERGIRHEDLYFDDGTCPTPALASRFFDIVETAPGAIAVHCKAGLGRTGTLIGLYAMKHFGFTARAYIAWSRFCRPGSILGCQQHFLEHVEAISLEAWLSPGAVCNSSAVSLDGLARKARPASLREASEESSRTTRSDASTRDGSEQHTDEELDVSRESSTNSKDSTTNAADHGFYVADVGQGERLLEARKSQSGR